MHSNPHYHGLILLTVVTALAVSVPAGAAVAPDGFRWFQVEISIFTNEFPEYRNAEFWSPERLELAYPRRTREFDRLADFLQIEELEQRVYGDLNRDPAGTPVAPAESLEVPGQQPEPPPPLTGPFPRRADGGLRLPDFERDSYLLLPTGLSDFQTTNARLERSPNNRLLFTGLWRQPVVATDDATALVVRGGREFGGRHELEGSVTVRFNQNEDRVVIDADLWLIEFTSPGTGDPAWKMPPLPPGPDRASGGAAGIDFGINRIVQMRQSRDMRSNEFHYLDHPALGLVISVHPYDPPPPAMLEVPVEAATAPDQGPSTRP